jgi:stage V sporulation protein T
MEKSTGIVRRVDDLGRVVIPKEIRRTFGVKEGDPLEIFVDKESQSIVLKLYESLNYREMWDELVWKVKDNEEMFELMKSIRDNSQI